PPPPIPYTTLFRSPAPSGATTRAGDPRSVRVDGFDLAAVPRPQGVEGALAVDAAVGVRAEEVALPLHERGRQPVGAQPVVVRERRRERRRGDARLGRGDHDATPGLLGAGHGIDRKSTRLNSSHVKNSYAVFCLKKK